MSTRVRVPEWAPARDRFAYLEATYPEGEWPDDAYSSSGFVRRGDYHAHTMSCVCGAKFEGSAQDEADFEEAHKNHQPTHCECCGAEL